MKYFRHMTSQKYRDLPSKRVHWHDLVLGQIRSATSRLCGAFVDLESLLTFTFEPLPKKAIQQRPTVITEGRGHVVVDFESMRYVDIESLGHHLQTNIEIIILIVTWEVSYTRVTSKASDLDIKYDLDLQCNFDLLCDLNRKSAFAFQSELYLITVQTDG